MEQSSPSVVGQIASDPALENGAHPTGDAIDLAEVGVKGEQAVDAAGGGAEVRGNNFGGGK